MNAQGQTFVVKYKARRGDTFAWWPKGESEECDATTARKRFGELLSAGQRGEPVEGDVPWRVSIERADIEPPPVLPLLMSPLSALASGMVGLPVERVMLSQYVIDEAPTGPWAERCAA